MDVPDGRGGPDPGRGRADARRSMPRPCGPDEAALLSFVSHELRTPLTVASGTLSMLASGRFGALPQPQQHAVEMAIRSVARVHALADDLSTTARIARGEWPLLTAPVAITDIIADVAHALQDRNTALVVDIPSDASPVTSVVDRGAIVRAVVALADLALRDAGAETVALRIAHREHATWLVVSAARPLDPVTTHGATPIDPAASGHGFALCASAALLELHGLHAVRLPAPAEIAAVGIAFPR